MAINNIRRGKLLYHLTELENLPSIIEHGLLPRKYAKQFKFKDVANQEIIEKRSKFNLDEYTPFHFHPYSAFDVAVKSEHKDDNLIYICIRREVARANGFKILPKHLLSISECTLYEYDEGFNKIDWEAMQTPGNENEYVKHVKMAECITDLMIPVDGFASIYVKDDETKELVESLLNKNDVDFPPPFVNVQKWF